MRTGFSKVILQVLNSTGPVNPSLLTGKIIKVFKGGFQEKDLKKYRRKIFQGLYYLNKKNYVTVSNQKNNVKISLTKLGRTKATESAKNDLDIKKPAVWDKKWRIVTFDIPVKYRHRAELIRRKLKKMNFYRLQKSLWVCPYDCTEQIDYIRDLYAVRPFLITMLVESLDDEKKLRNIFKI